MLESVPVADVCRAPATPCLVSHVAVQVAKTALPNSGINVAHIVVWFFPAEWHFNIIPSAPDVILVGNNDPKLEQMQLIHGPSLEAACRTALAQILSWI